MASRGFGDFSIAAAVNNEGILRQCLARSPDIVSGTLRLNTYRGYQSAARALNDAIDNASSDILILVHQDVYLPRGWLARLTTQINALDTAFPNWSVIGAFGRTINGNDVGRVWSSGLSRELGQADFKPSEVISLDELLLVLRRSSGLRFDEMLPSFHMYGTDIVLQGKRNGLKAFAVNAPVVHHDKPVASLRGGYAQAYYYMRQKWCADLPIPTLICDISRLPIPLWRAQFRRWKAHWRGTQQFEGDPVNIAKMLKYE
jgi:glycosyltransferase involved in cell wall biosynthesis